MHSRRPHRPFRATGGRVDATPSAIPPGFQEFQSVDPCVDPHCGVSRRGFLSAAVAATLCKAVAIRGGRRAVQTGPDSQIPRRCDWDGSSIQCQMMQREDKSLPCWVLLSPSTRRRPSAATRLKIVSTSSCRRPYSTQTPKPMYFLGSPYSYEPPSRTRPPLFGPDCKSQGGAVLRNNTQIHEHDSYRSLHPRF